MLNILPTPSSHVCLKRRVPLLGSHGPLPDKICIPCTLRCAGGGACMHVQCVLCVEIADFRHARAVSGSHEGKD